MNDIFGVFRPVFWTSPQCPQCFPIKSVPHKLKSHRSLSVNGYGCIIVIIFSLNPIIFLLTMNTIAGTFLSLEENIS